MTRWLADLNHVELGALLLCAAAVLDYVTLPIRTWVLGGADAWEDPC